eukprot:COSAG01_NODE_1620_length_9713_cov_4.117433_4_plen_227_part_00
MSSFREGTIRTRERYGLDRPPPAEDTDGPTGDKPIGRFRACLASRHSVSIVFRVDCRKAKPGPHGYYPWRLTNKALIRTRRSKSIHVDGAQRKYDLSEDGEAYLKQVARQLKGLGEHFLHKWWTEYNYSRRFFWTQKQQIGCIGQVLEEHCSVLTSLDTKIILPRTDRLGKVLLLPIGTTSTNETADHIIEKEIVRCLQISDGAGREEVGGESNEKLRIREVILLH